MIVERAFKRKNLATDGRGYTQIKRDDDVFICEKSAIIRG